MKNPFVEIYSRYDLLDTSRHPKDRRLCLGMYYLGIIYVRH